MFGFGKTKKLEDVIETQSGVIRSLYVVIEREAEIVKDLRREKKKCLKNRRAPLSRKRGYHKVKPEEAEEMYDLYQADMSMVDIANKLGRSQSCVSKNIRKHLGSKDEQ